MESGCQTRTLRECASFPITNAHESTLRCPFRGTVDTVPVPGFGVSRNGPFLRDPVAVTPSTPSTDLCQGTERQRRSWTPLLPVLGRGISSIRTKGSRGGRSDGNTSVHLSESSPVVIFGPTRSPVLSSAVGPGLHGEQSFHLYFCSDPSSSGVRESSWGKCSR